MTYWAVTSAYKDDGSVAAAISGMTEASQRPQAGYKETRSADIYTDWFDSYQKAQAFVDECKAG